MTTSPASSGELARQLIAVETTAVTSPAQLEAGVQRVFQRLHELMSSLVGPTGFSAAMRRALANTPDCAWLDPAASRGGTAGTQVIQGIAGAVEREGTERVVECATLLLENVLGLLCSFIGNDLTVRLVRQSWPELPAASSIPSREDP